MNLSRLALSLGQSATLKLNELANNLKAEGKPVIHLGGGEPEEKIPRGALEESGKMLDAGFVRYTPTSGTAALMPVTARTRPPAATSVTRCCAACMRCTPACWRSWAFSPARKWK